MPPIPDRGCRQRLTGANNAAIIFHVWAGFSQAWRDTQLPQPIDGGELAGGWVEALYGLVQFGIVVAIMMDERHIVGKLP